MAKLILKFNNEIVDHIELTQGDMKIGRKPSNEIFVDNLAVSGEHANIFTIGDDSFVQDLGSTNGTYVNSKKITKHHLRNGDVINVGKHAMVYFSEPESHGEENTEDFAKTVIITPTSDKPDTANAAPVASADKTLSMKAEKPKPGRQGAIFVLNGANSGKRIELSKTITNLGKTGKVAGSIIRSSGGYKLSAGVAGDPPKLNGRALEPSSEHALKNGDIIEVIGTRLQFYFK